MGATFHTVLPILLIGGALTNTPAFIPGEVLVRFMPGSAGDAAVEKALQVVPPDIQKLAPIVNELQTASRIPLKASRLASGRWVVLAVDSDQLSDRAAGDLRRCKHIDSIEVIDQETPPPSLMPKPKSLRIRFTSQSAESEVLSKVMGGTGNKPFEKLIRELSDTLGLPLKGHVQNRDRLILEIDLAALTVILVERLRTVSGVGFVQPNYMSGFLTP